MSEPVIIVLVCMCEFTSVLYYFIIDSLIISNAIPHFRHYQHFSNFTTNKIHIVAVSETHRKNINERLSTVQFNLVKDLTQDNTQCICSALNSVAE